MGRAAGQFTTTWLALCVMGCGVASPAPDGAADVALAPIDAPRDAVTAEDTPDTEVVHLADRPDATASDAGEADAVALDDGPFAGDVDDAATHDVDVVLPTDDAATPDVDVVHPADDAAQDVVTPSDDAGASDATTEDDATPDMDVVSPPVDATAGADVATPLDGDDARSTDAPPLADCAGCCASDGDCADDEACVEGRCLPPWRHCPGVSLTVDGPSVRVVPTRSSTPSMAPSTTCAPGLPRGDAVVFSLRAFENHGLRLRSSGLPADARVELRRSCDDGAPSLAACEITGDFDRVFSSVPAGDWFVVVEAAAFAAPFELSATDEPGRRVNADVCPGARLVPDTPGLLIPGGGFALTSGPNIPESGLNSTSWSDWAAGFHLDRPRDVVVHAENGDGSAPYLLSLHSPCGRLLSHEQFSRVTELPVFRALPAGDYAVVGATLSADVHVWVTTAEPDSGRLRGDACATAAPVPTDGASAAIDLRGFDPRVELGASCSTARRLSSGASDAVWTFSLAERSDVRLSVSAPAMAVEVRRGCGPSTTRVGECVNVVSSREFSLRDLDPGEYSVVAVQPPRSGPVATVDASLSVTRWAPSSRATGDTCATAAPLTVDGEPSVIAMNSMAPTADLDTVRTRWQLDRAHPDAVWRLRLDRESDLALTFENAPPGFAWQLQRRCAPGSGLVITTFTATTRRFSALAPGEYFVVAAWTGLQTGDLSLRAVATAAAPQAAGESCAAPISLTVGGEAVTLDPATTREMNEGPRALTTSVLYPPDTTSVDAVFRYDGGAGEPLVAEVTLTRGNFSVEDRSVCDDVDTAGPSEGTGPGTYLYPLRPTAAGGGYVIVGVGPSPMGAPRSLSVRVRAATASSAPRYASSTPPASVTWTEVCDLPGAQRLMPDADATFTTAPLPFAVSFFGRAFPAGHPMAVTSTGFVSFAPLAATEPLPQIPTTPSIALAMYLRPSVGREGVCVATVGAAPNRRWLVSWPSLNNAFDATLRRQFALHESGRVDVITLDDLTFSGADVGLVDPSGRVGTYVPSPDVRSYVSVRFDPIP